MAVTIYGPREIAAIERASAAAAGTLAYVAGRLRPGVATAEIDGWVREDTRRRGGLPSQLGYRGGGGGRAFPASVCTSRNAVMLHGGAVEVAGADAFGLD